MDSPVNSSSLKGGCTMGDKGKKDKEKGIKQKKAKQDKKLKGKQSDK